MDKKKPPLRSLGYVDPGWQHGTPQDNLKRKVKCNYCERVVSGGVFRFKLHLARIPGQVAHCNNVPEEVYLKMKENLEGCQSTKKLKRSRGKRALEDPRYVDPGWEHGDAQDWRKKKVKCNYCKSIISGGVNRFKQHLARIPGEVAACKKAPEEVYLKIKENMKWHRTGRRPDRTGRRLDRRPDANDMEISTMQSDNDEEEHQDEEEPVALYIDDSLIRTGGGPDRRPDANDMEVSTMQSDNDEEEHQDEEQPVALYTDDSLIRANVRSI